MKYTERDVDRVARTILGEALNESYDGKVAVANTIANRAYQGFNANGRREQGYANSDVGSIATNPAQYNAWSPNFSGAYKNTQMKSTDPRYQEARAIAEGVLSGSIPDNTMGATHYYNPDVASPAWGQDALNASNFQAIGHHNFASVAPGLMSDRNAFEQAANLSVSPDPSKARSAANADQLAERGYAATPQGRMWGAVESVVGPVVAGAMKTGAVPIGIGIGLAQQAWGASTGQAQPEANVQPNTPANQMRQALGLPAHPSTPTPSTATFNGAPVGAVTNGGNLSPAQQMHAAISSQYGGSPLAAEAAAAREGISYSGQQLADGNALTAGTPSPGTPGRGKPGELGTQQTYSAPARQTQPEGQAVTTPMGFQAPSVSPDIGTSLTDTADARYSVSPQTEMDTNNVAADVAAVTNGMPESAGLLQSGLVSGLTPAPGSITNPKPGELGYAPPVAAPAPVQRRPVSRPKPMPAPRYIPTLQVAQPKPQVQQAPPVAAGLSTLVGPAKPGSSLYNAVANANLGAAPQGYSWGLNSLTGSPVTVANSAPEGVKIAASGTGILGALGLVGNNVNNNTQQSPGFFSSLASGLGGLFGGGWGGSNGGSGASSNGGGYGGMSNGNANSGGWGNGVSGGEKSGGRLA